MKRLLIILFLFILTISVKAEYDSTYVLACKQKFAISECVRNGDSVGEWKHTYTWMSGNDITFAIQTNYFDAFAINSTGMLRINDKSHINGIITSVQQDTSLNLIIRTTDATLDYFEDDTAVVWIKDSVWSIFSDWDYTGTEAGTRTQPYNNRDEQTWTAGYGYFFKRGSTLPDCDEYFTGIKATAAHPMILAAYGAGAKPIVDGSSAACFMWYFGSAAADSVEYIYMYDIVTQNTDYSAVHVKRYCDHLGFYNCDFLNCGQVAVGDYEGVVVMGTASYADSLRITPLEMINCTWNTIVGTNSNALKSGASPTIIHNCSVNDVQHGAGIRITMGKDSEVKYTVVQNLGDTPGEYALQIRGDSVTVEDVRLINGYRAIDIAEACSPPCVHVPDYCILKNVYTKDFVSYLFYVDGSNGIMYNNTIEDCHFDNGGTNGALIYRSRNMVWRYNLFDNVPITFGSTYNKNIYFYYNIGWGDDLLCSAGTNYSILNNTWDDDINLTGASSETLRNCYFKSLTDPGTVSDNADIDTITTATTFINYAGHDYSLKATAWGINRAYEVGATRDYDGNTKSGSLWDIGAYEFQLSGDKHYIIGHLMNEYINGKRINRHIK